MTSRQEASIDPATSFPNKSPALYRGNKQLRKGKADGEVESAIGLGDMRSFPVENGKTASHKNGTSHHKSRGGPSGKREDRVNSIITDLPDTSPDFRLWTDIDGGRTCALLRSTTKLHEASTWRDLVGVEEFIIDDDDGALKVIPSEMANLRALRVLTIRWSPLKFIGPEVAHLELTQLYFDKNRLKNIDTVCNIRSLTVLNVSSNVIEVLPDNIGNLSYLREMDVSGNRLRALPESIGKLSLLNVLNVSSNRLVTLPSSIGKLTDVSMLDISGNRLREIPAEIGDMENLVCLFASHNQIFSLPNTLSKCSKLESAFLRTNQFIEVPEVLSRVQCLKVLNMKDNFIESMKAPMKSLKCLILDNNNFEEMPDEAFDGDELEMLSIVGNTISSIPKNIARLKRLRRLYLAANEIKEIPSVIGELSELRHLDLEKNSITTIPLRISDLKNLSLLRLEKSELQGNWASVYTKGTKAVQNFAQRLERGSVLLIKPSSRDSGLESPGVPRESELQIDSRIIESTNGQVLTKENGDVPEKSKVA